MSTVAVSLLYKLQTMNIFGDGLGDQGAADADEEWPPFRKVRQNTCITQFHFFEAGLLYCTRKKSFVV